MKPLIKHLDTNYPNLKYKIKTKNIGDEELSMLSIRMPDGKSHFLFMPLPQSIEENVDKYVMSDTEGIYHHIKPSAAYAIQPRRTICYSFAYKYSGVTHPVEPKTPKHIRKLYRVTNELFGLAEGVNMDLVNYYPTGRHYISAHSDNEKQFGNLKDVYCWTFGPAKRLAIFRDVETKEIVLQISIPEGLYVMQGLSFQKHYTHEFPELHPALFKRICKRMIKEDPDFPKDVDKSELGASQEKLVWADWIKENRKRVRKLIKRGEVGPKGKVDSDLENFDEWCDSRTSHTLRQFVTL